MGDEYQCAILSPGKSSAILSPGKSSAILSPGKSISSGVPHHNFEEYKCAILSPGKSSAILSPGKIISSPVLASKRLGDVHIPSPDQAVCIAASEHFEKSGLVAAQEAALHDSAVLEMGYQMTESEYSFMPEGVVLKAPSIGSVKDLRALKLVRLKNLKVGKVHKGKILSGTLCCKSVKTTAVMNVFEEDGTGDTTRLMVANAIPRSATTSEAQRLYPEGARLSVREPYLKRFSDGMVGLLVENPVDIIFNYLPEELPSPDCEKVELPSKLFREKVSGSEGQETPGQPVEGSSQLSPHQPVIGYLASLSNYDHKDELSFLAESRTDENVCFEPVTASSSEGVINHGNSLSGSYCRSISLRTDELEGRATEKFVDCVTDSVGNDPRRNSLNEDEFWRQGVMNRVEMRSDHKLTDIEEKSINPAPADPFDTAPSSAPSSVCLETFNRQGNSIEDSVGMVTISQDVEADSERCDKTAIESVFPDPTDSSVECIKSVVEESVEMSVVAEGDSEKGMPDNSGDCPKVNGTERGQSPTSETPVVKGVIAVETKTNKGATNAGSDQHDLDLSAASLRLLGNKFFARQDWARAIELYTKAILRAVQESKENASPNREKSADQPFNDEPESEVVMDYSNRAEAWLRLHHYERAWADAERALSLDPNHLKSLFRKGRALLGVGDYQQALAHLETAYARAPFDKDLLAAIQMSRIGDHQSRLGIYDLSDYYLRGRFVREVPSCADYVGPVQVKAASGDKGRGLFLTKAVQAGDLLLVSNPLAMLESKSGSKVRKNVLESSAKGGLRIDKEVGEKLVHAVRERAKVSSKNRQRLLALCHVDGATLTIPSMDLFIAGKRVEPVETPELDDARLHNIVTRNAIDRNMVSTPNERRVFHREVAEDTPEDRCFYGLWVLPSFINHSCIPNVSLVVMGRALFVYASKDLSAGEELLCSYYNVFQPLPYRRDLASRCWGFSCRCARCLLETRFESSLKRLYALHARLEASPTFVLQFSPFGYKAPAKDLAKELEIIETSKKLDNRERSWLQASFTQLYTVSRDFMGPHGNHPYLDTALRAMELVCPGSNSTLEVGLLAREATRNESSGKKSPQYKTANHQVLRICQCIYGKQRIPVLQSLVDGTPPDVTSKN